jgi:energy-coupling factor transporter ATP-binding protein EcfA2
LSPWDSFPADYRSAEVRAIRSAARAGECVAVVGLSGAGKSNLLGFLAGRPAAGGGPHLVLVDGNRLAEPTAAGFLDLMRLTLAPDAGLPHQSDALSGLEVALAPAAAGGVCFLLDLSLLLDRQGRLLEGRGQGLWGNLRALRDRHKFALSYVVATRHPLPRDNELAELFFGHTLWLGPLNEADARWNVARYAERTGQAWNATQVAAMLAVSGRYPALLRGVCEACAAGLAPTPEVLAPHEAVAARVAEFWADQPEPDELVAAGLTGVPLLARPAVPASSLFDTSQLTAKEHRLLQVFETRPGAVVEKDELIRAVWPEDQIFESGVRDDSLAQLVRRLREKIEPNAARPQFILTVTGRGYRFVRPAVGHA